MPKVLCTLENASNEINGHKFFATDGGMLSEDLSDEAAERLLSIPGYELAQDEEQITSARAPAPASKSAPKAAEKPAPKVGKKASQATEKPAEEPTEKPAEQEPGQSADASEGGDNLAGDQASGEDPDAVF